MKILLAEDTKDLNHVLVTFLEHEGYTVDPCFDGQEAIEHLQTDSYDAVILDIMMPRKDGIQALRELRAANIVTPVLMLTAKAEVDDRVEGLDAGADDYLTKPFAMKELAARIRAMVRRKTDYSVEKLSYRDISLNGENFEIGCVNSIRLSIKEYELMQTMVMNAGKEITTEYLLDHIWAGEAANADTVWLYVSYLKRKLLAISSEVTIEGNKGESFKLS